MLSHLRLQRPRWRRAVQQARQQAEGQVVDGFEPQILQRPDRRGPSRARRARDEDDPFGLFCDCLVFVIHLWLLRASLFQILADRGGKKRVILAEDQGHGASGGLSGPMRRQAVGF